MSDLKPSFRLDRKNRLIDKNDVVDYLIKSNHLYTKKIFEYLNNCKIFYLELEPGFRLDRKRRLVDKIILLLTVSDKINHLWTETYLNTVEPAHEVTSIKQSHVLKGHLFLVLS